MSAGDVDLQIAGVTVQFGGVTAVNDATLHARGGVITGLIGPNGAGKTTMFNACSGRVRPTSGTVHLGGKSMDRMSSASRAHLGLGRTFQRMELFESMTVLENVRTGPEAMYSSAHFYGQLFSTRKQSQQILERSRDALERCGIGGLAKSTVGDLSTGQRRLVELARALATPFSFLLLDEPSSGLDVHETEEFGRVISQFVRDTGTGILLVEHDMSLVADVCEQIYVLDFGRIIYTGTTAEALSSDIVRSAYLGEVDLV